MAPQPVAMPAGLRPVLAFVNTVDVESGTDLLDGGPAALGRWLSQEKLGTGDLTPTPAHVRLARDLRRGLRALLLANNGGATDAGPTDAGPIDAGGIDADDLAAGERALARLPLVASLDGEVLRPDVDDPVLVALGAVVIGYASARADGSWHRLRRCPAEDCAWVFWDSSARAGRRWCTMRICGNRAKARAYAARRRPPAR